MRKLLAVALLAFAASWSVTAAGQISGYPRNPKFGNVDVAGTLSSSKACAANYTRIGPNLCVINDNSLATAAAITMSTCTTVTAPTGAKAVLLLLHGTIVSANAIGDRWLLIEAHQTNACGNVIAQHMSRQEREYVATAAGTTIGRYMTWSLAWVNSGSNFFLFASPTGSVSHTANYVIMGYYD